MTGQQGAGKDHSLSILESSVNIFVLKVPDEFWHETQTAFHTWILEKARAPSARNKTASTPRIARSIAIPKCA